MHYTGVVGKASRYSFADRGTLHLYQRSTFRSNAYATFGRMDIANTISSKKGFRCIRMSNLYDTAYRTSGSSYNSW